MDAFWHEHCGLNVWHDHGKNNYYRCYGKNTVQQNNYDTKRD